MSFEFTEPPVEFVRWLDSAYRMFPNESDDIKTLDDLTILLIKRLMPILIRYKFTTFKSFFMWFSDRLRKENPIIKDHSTRFLDHWEYQIRKWLAEDEYKFLRQNR